MRWDEVERPPIERAEQSRSCYVRGGGEGEMMGSFTPGIVCWARNDMSCMVDDVDHQDTCTLPITYPSIITYLSM